MLTPARIAVLVSGGGTNLQALLDAQRDGKMPHGEIVLVVSSRAGAYALTRAENAGVAARVLTPSCGQEPFENELSVLLREQEIDLMLKEIPQVVRYLRSMSPVWNELLAGTRQFIL